MRAFVGCLLSNASCAVCCCVLCSVVCCCCCVLFLFCFVLFCVWLRYNRFLAVNRGANGAAAGQGASGGNSGEKRLGRFALSILQQLRKDGLQDVDCPICLDNPMDVPVFGPCAHTWCHACASSLYVNGDRYVDVFALWRIQVLWEARRVVTVCVRVCVCVRV